MNNAQFFDVQQRQKELASERLHSDQAQSRACAVFAECVAEIQSHVRKDDAEVISIHKTIVDGNAVLRVLRILVLNLLEQRQLVLRIARYLLDASKHFDRHGLIGLVINAAENSGEYALSGSSITRYLYAKISPTYGL